MAEETASNDRPSVLIVDRSPETREILRTLLERRGMRTWEAELPADGMQIAEQQQPQVIVFDCDDEPASEARIRVCAEQHGGSLIILATARRTANSPDDGPVVTKPYHYGPLLRKIEALASRVS